jgi:hypothetical protein
MVDCTWSPCNEGVTAACATGLGADVLLLDELPRAANEGAVRALLARGWHRGGGPGRHVKSPAAGRRPAREAVTDEPRHVDIVPLDDPESIAIEMREARAAREVDNAADPAIGCDHDPAAGRCMAAADRCRNPWSCRRPESLRTERRSLRVESSFRAGWRMTGNQRTIYAHGPR